jgi:hypothetical protein
MTGLADMEMMRTGWLEKYSVGRGLIPLKNWQRRWFCVDHAGLNYSKSPMEAPSRRTFIPFVAGPGANGDVVMAPVYLYPNVTESIHPEAVGSSIYYFALRFQERGTPRLLLVRTNDSAERERWVRFLSLFVHAAALSGIPPSHPSAQKKGVDPDELDPRERLLLKQTILDWDEGMQLRMAGVAEPVATREGSFEDCAVWNSDEEVSGHPSRRNSKSNNHTPGVQSPRRPSSNAASPALGGSGAPELDTPEHGARENGDDYDCL